MKELFAYFGESITQSLDWTLRMITFEVPWYNNYFYGLILISLAVWALEMALPWRKQQGAFRKDFWLDGFYMFFNFFVFQLPLLVLTNYWKLVLIASGCRSIACRFQPARFPNVGATAHLFCSA